MKSTFQPDSERVALIVESAAMEAGLAARSIPGVTGTDVWNTRVRQWRERGVFEQPYSRRPRKSVGKRKRRLISDLRRAKNMPPKVETGEELIRLGEKVWQDRAVLAKDLEMCELKMSAAAVRQAQCSRIGWVRECKAHGHLWHRVFRCGLRFCPLCMSSVYEALFYEALERLAPVAVISFRNGQPGEVAPAVSSLKSTSQFEMMGKCRALRRFGGSIAQLGDSLCGWRA